MPSFRTHTNEVVAALVKADHPTSTLYPAHFVADLKAALLLNTQAQRIEEIDHITDLLAKAKLARFRCDQSMAAKFAAARMAAVNALLAKIKAGGRVGA